MKKKKNIKNWLLAHEKKGDIKRVSKKVDREKKN